MKESEGNDVQSNIQGECPWQKHPGSCAFAELELLSYTKPRRVVQNEKNSHKNSNNSHYNYHDENHDEIESIKEIVKGVHNNTQHQNNAHSKTKKTVL